MLPTELPHVPPSVEPTTSQSMNNMQFAMGTLRYSTSGPGIQHGATVAELSTAVAVCIAVAIVLFMVAVVLSVVIVILGYQRRRVLALNGEHKNSPARTNSDDIRTTFV